MTTTNSEAPRFIDCPMPELTFDKDAVNYVAIYDVVTSEHSLITCSADDLVDPAAPLAHFDRVAAGQIGLDREDIAMELLSLIHHEYVAAPVLDENILNRLRVGTYVLTEIEQHPWFFIVRAPHATSMFRVPVCNAKQFHKWLYTKGKQALLDIANDRPGSAIHEHDLGQCTVIGPPC